MGILYIYWDLVVLICCDSLLEVQYCMHRAPMGYPHGLISYKDTKTKCRHLKKLTCKGIPLPPPPLLSLCQSTVYRHCVAGSEWGGIKLCWRPYPGGV